MEIHLKSILFQLGFYRIGIVNAQRPSLNGLHKKARCIHDPHPVAPLSFLRRLSFVSSVAKIHPRQAAIAKHALSPLPNRWE
jgi:hypothetical protein